MSFVCSGKDGNVNKNVMELLVQVRDRRGEHYMDHRRQQREEISEVGAS